MVVEEDGGFVKKQSEIFQRFFLNEGETPLEPESIHFRRLELATRYAFSDLSFLMPLIGHFAGKSGNNSYAAPGPRIVPLGKCDPGIGTDEDEVFTNHIISQGDRTNYHRGYQNEDQYGDRCFSQLFPVHCQDTENNKWNHQKVVGETYGSD